MYYVYVLKSKKNQKNYIGFTGKHPEQRLKEHNFGSGTFTKQNRPFELIYFEEYNDEIFARKREQFFKSGSGRNFLQRKILDKVSAVVRRGLKNHGLAHHL